jgi:hypothetical protein
MKTIKSLALSVLTLSAFGQIAPPPAADSLPFITVMESIATDRPDRSSTARTVPVGWLQYEGGYQFSRDQVISSLETNTNTHQVDELLRFGINERFEIRAHIYAASELKDQPQLAVEPVRFTGVRPTSVGFKYNIARAGNWSPEVSWLSELSMPWLAYGDFRVPTQGNMMFQQQTLLIEKSLPYGLALTTNVGVAGTLTPNGGLINSGLFTLSASYSGYGFGLYAEYYSNWTITTNRIYGKPYVNTGIFKNLSNDLKLDLYAGLDLSPYMNTVTQSSGFFIGTGISYRLPVAQYL